MPKGERALFTPVVAEERLDARFVGLRDDPAFAPARRLMGEMYEDFVDRDGNFVEQFQTTGFDSRCWELYVFSLLWSMGAQFDWSEPRPDFTCRIRGQRVHVEATIAGPSREVARAELVDRPPEAGDERVTYVQNAVPIKLGSPFWKKLGKGYPDLPHVAGDPFILAVAPFYGAESHAFSDSSMIELLYGTRDRASRGPDQELVLEPEPVEEFEFEGKVIKAGFFRAPTAAGVSAVLYSNAGTISKFQRLSFQMRPDDYPDLRILRQGLAFQYDRNAKDPAPFKYVVGDPRLREGWDQSASVIHNPWTTVPLEIRGWGGICEHRLRADGLVGTRCRGFIPLRSKTLTYRFHRRDQAPPLRFG